MNITKETAIALAKEAGLFGYEILGMEHDIHRLCNLAVKHAQKDAKLVAWRTFDGEGDYDYRTFEDNENYAEEWEKRNPNHKGWVEPVYLHPAHDDTALLRMALGALNNSTPVLGDYQDENAEAQQKHIAAITALRERLGEKA